MNAVKFAISTDLDYLYFRAKFEVETAKLQRSFSHNIFNPQQPKP